jgi:hypothetical protein
MHWLHGMPTTARGGSGMPPHPRARPAQLTWLDPDGSTLAAPRTLSLAFGSRSRAPIPAKLARPRPFAVPERGAEAAWDRLSDRRTLDRQTDGGSPMAAPGEPCAGHGVSVHPISSFPCWIPRAAILRREVPPKFLVPGLEKTCSPVTIPVAGD